MISALQNPLVQSIFCIIIQLFDLLFPKNFSVLSFGNGQNVSASAFSFLFLSSCSLSPFLPSPFEVHWNHTTVLSNVVPVICKHLQKMSIQMYCKCGTISMFYILFYFVVWFWMDIKNVTMISLLLSFVPIIFLFFFPSIYWYSFSLVFSFLFIVRTLFGFHWTPHNPIQGYHNFPLIFHTSAWVYCMTFV